MIATIHASSIIIGLVWLAAISFIAWAIFSRSPRQQGFQAALDGQTRWKNPHDPGTIPWADWLMGWCEGIDKINSNHEEE